MPVYHSNVLHAKDALKTSKFDLRIAVKSRRAKKSESDDRIAGITGRLKNKCNEDGLI